MKTKKLNSNLALYTQNKKKATEYSCLFYAIKSNFKKTKKVALKKS